MEASLELNALGSIYRFCVKREIGKTQNVGMTALQLRFTDGKESDVRLNPIEFMVMNNPFRVLVQRFFEAPRLAEAAGEVPHCGKALEIGCGQGAGALIILERFRAETVDAFDYDLRMARLAKRRLARISLVRAVWQGDATRIAAKDAAYDSVFDFGAVHHIVDWRNAISEVNRVLRPGGIFFAQEVFRDLIAHPLWRRLLHHPQQDRFDFDQFEAALTSAGFSMIGTSRFGRGLGWFVCQKAPHRA